MKYILKKRHFRATDKAILEDLGMNARRLGKKTISARLYSSTGRYDSTIMRRRFGGWNNALRKAGLEIKQHNRVSETELLGNLKRVWDRLKRQPVCREVVRPLSEYSYNTYINKFGSWQKALETFIKYLRDPEKCNFPKDKKTKAQKRGRKRKRKQRNCFEAGKSLRYDILKRDNFRCRLCGASPAVTRGVALHVDHIIPRSKNGKTIPENLQTLCSDCNYGKGSKSPPLSPPEGGRKK